MMYLLTEGTGEFAQERLLNYAESHGLVHGDVVETLSPRGAAATATPVWDKPREIAKREERVSGPGFTPALAILYTALEAVRESAAESLQSYSQGEIDDQPILSELQDRIEAASAALAKARGETP